MNHPILRTSIGLNNKRLAKAFKVNNTIFIFVNFRFFYLHF